MKKLFALLFYAAAIAFAVFVGMYHKGIYQSLFQTKFTDAAAIKTFAASIVSIIPDIILFLMLFFSLLSFLIHIGNTAKISKRLIKCGQRVGAYFVSLQIWTFVASLFSIIGTEGWVETIKSTVTNSHWYLPVAIMIVGTIVLIVARFISRGGPISGIIVTIGMAILIVNNFTFYLTDTTDTSYLLIFILSVGACALACITAFIPEMKRDTKE